MITTIDASGRLVIPREVRREARLKAGDRLEVRCREGRVELEHAPLAVRLVRKGELLVAVPVSEPGKLTREMVEETRRALGAERGEKTRK
jgi:AbrB family looped-hinge helix DNA binding protein